MIPRPRSATFFILDLLILYACFLGVFVHYLGFISIPIKGVILMLLIALVWFIIALNSSIATVHIQSKISSIFKDILIGYSVLSASVIFVTSVFGEFTPNNKLILWPLFYGFILSFTIRFLYLVSSKHFVKEGYQQKSILLIGGDRVAERTMRQIMSGRQLGYRLYGILADYYHETLPKGFYLGKLDRFSEIVRSGAVDEVIIALPLRMEPIICDLVEKCELEGIRVRIVPDFFRMIRNRIVLEDLGDIPLIGIRTEPLSLLKNRVLKRAFDIVFSLMVMVLFSPAFAVIAIAIKATSEGHVFFRQERVSTNNRPFQMTKFRTMYSQDNKISDTKHTSVNDQRITPVGKFLRRHSLDELPQFWNVLKGDMSIVGPRPELTHFVNVFGKNITRYKVRHLVRSGITGWAQVNGWRGNTSKEKRIECDLYYIENWSFWLDLKIIWLTVVGRETQNHAY